MLRDHIHTLPGMFLIGAIMIVLFSLANAHDKTLRTDVANIPQ